MVRCDVITCIIDRNSMYSDRLEPAINGANRISVAARGIGAVNRYRILPIVVKTIDQLDKSYSDFETDDKHVRPLLKKRSRPEKPQATATTATWSQLGKKMAKKKRIMYSFAEGGGEFDFLV